MITILGLLQHVLSHKSRPELCLGCRRQLNSFLRRQVRVIMHHARLDSLFIEHRTVDALIDTVAAL